MASKKGRQTVSWTKHDDRKYLRGFSYASIMSGGTEHSLAQDMARLIPNWKRAFDGDHEPTLHALYERGEKARRYPKELPKDPEDVKIWVQASGDFHAKKITWKFSWENKNISHLTKQVITVSPTTEIVELRIKR